MHDIRAIREDPAGFDRALGSRGLPPSAASLLERDEQRRAVLTELQTLQARRNQASREIGDAKRQGRDAQALIDEVARIRERMTALEEAERQLGEALSGALAVLPNLPAPDVPVGADEHSNAEIRRWGETQAGGTPEHFELGEALGLMDFAAAAGMSGARFVVLKGALARLERALGQFMIDLHTRRHGYTEVSPPLLVRSNALFGTGQLPKFAEDLFHTTTDHWLIPTAEVPLTNLVADQIVPAETLPLRYTALTPCFRSEAGAAGRDTRGMIRQHQFYKCELVSITAPAQAADEHERMLDAAETVLKLLELPYRVVLLCTGDMGFSARKTYDIEVWLPGQGAYREISSCSDCGDFQARRMQARCRARGEKAVRPVHTLNGSGVAVGRALIAVMETYRQADGSIAIPDALRPYLPGLERIGPEEGLH